MTNGTLVHALVAVWLICAAAHAAGPRTPSPDVQRYIKVDATALRLVHVRLIDGTGAAPREDQTIVIRDGRIAWLGTTDQLTGTDRGLPALELPGYSVIPGIVGMHDHLFYAASLDYDEKFNLAAPGPLLSEIAFSGPRLYLAAGVTTVRTTGSMSTYTDLSLRRQIESGVMVGPDIDVTGPYLQGQGGPFPQMPALTSVDEVRQTVNFWADRGATSFKAYTHLSRAQLRAAIDQVHQRGLRITGHLCSVSYREAAALGIDNLEHGPVYTDSGFVPNRRPDVCPSGSAIAESWLGTDIASSKVQELIQHLIAHKVAITSTLPVFELRLPGRPPLPQPFLEAMSAPARESYLRLRARVPTSSPTAVALFEKEMEFELAFARAGGLLLAGPDPTGLGGVLPGFGNHRAIELLVEAGFTPLEAIRVATANGAEYLRRSHEIGTVSVGKRANLVVIKGDPSVLISDIENVEIVFKDGVAYDSRKLLESVRGVVGIR